MTNFYDGLTYEVLEVLFKIAVAAKINLQLCIQRTSSGPPAQNYQPSLLLLSGVIIFVIITAEQLLQQHTATENHTALALLC